MTKPILLHITPLLLFLIALLSAGCKETSDELPNYVVSGEEVTLTLPVSFPSMETATRASLDANSLNTVESLWVRTYSAATGEATGDWMKYSAQDGQPLSIEEVTLKTKSGLSYIVGVANVENLGVTRSNPDTPVPLSQLLDKADSWNDFLSIAAVTPATPEQVRAPVAPLTMSGCYTDLLPNEPTRTDEWQNRNFQPYFIPLKREGVKFDGAIRLRRLVSHLSFNFIPGNDQIELTVNSFQVKNAPAATWLYEQGAASGNANFSDFAASPEEAEKYFKDIPRFGAQFITKNPDGSSSFDFWQGENKRTGTSTTYHQREHRSDADPSLFTSLTGDIWTPDNEASYLLVSCSVNYKNVISVDSEGEIAIGGTNVFRSGEVTYLIHLGYTGNGSEEEKATDFNCFRNVEYTYDITVSGLSDIRVDAYAKDETFHGEEGIVVDLQYSTIELDAHYNVFNIQLTEEELSGANFGFIITAYENGEQYSITDSNPQGMEGGNKVIYTDASRTKKIDPKFYNWIELRPTLGKNVIADYKPRYATSGTAADGRTFLLTDLQGGWKNMLPAMKSSSGWYTVFINEYAYESLYTGADKYADELWKKDSARPNWMGYVNENPRRFYIRITQSVSPDGKSTYARSKYSVSQQSIMTFYSSHTLTQDGTAIGIERMNENLGMNLRHTFAGGTSSDNGRWNTAQYLNGSPTSTSLNINNSASSGRPQWKNYVISSQYMEVEGVTSWERRQGGVAIEPRTIASGNPVPLHRPVPLAGDATVRNATYSDPQPENLFTIEAINACMNRNRDNNGNGTIEPDELRWYVPGLEQYLHIVLGRNSLPEPLMDYKNIPDLPKINKSPLVNNSLTYTWTQDASGEIDNKYYSRYMFIGSNAGVNVLWGMEGTSTSEYDKVSTWAHAPIRPWQVRCVRNLGSNMTTVTATKKVTTAYTHDAASRTIRMTHYDLASIRANRYLSNGNGASQLPVHTIASHHNSVYYGFRYAPEDITVPSDNLPSEATLDEFNSTLNRLDSYVESNPCSQYGSGWRLPNQIELSMMQDEGLCKNTHAAAVWLSCTVNYFDYADGIGTNDTARKYYLIALPGQCTQLTQTNLKSSFWYDTDHVRRPHIYVRCVRDEN